MRVTHGDDGGEYLEGVLGCDIAVADGDDCRDGPVKGEQVAVGQRLV